MDYLKTTNILSPSFVSVHTSKDYGQISLYESTEQKIKFIRNHFQKGQELFVANPVITYSRPEQAFWLFCSGAFIPQGDRKGEWS